MEKIYDGPPYADSEAPTELTDIYTLKNTHTGTVHFCNRHMMMSPDVTLLSNRV